MSLLVRVKKPKMFVDSLETALTDKGGGEAVSFSLSIVLLVPLPYPLAVESLTNRDIEAIFLKTYQQKCQAVFSN